MPCSVGSAAAGQLLLVALRNALIEASPQQVWDVLSDGYSYAQWVVGTREIREVDGNWPDVGARLHYSIGAGPLTAHDVTVVRVSEAPRHLELEANASPVGSARISIDLTPWGDECLVVVDEHPLRGPGLLLQNPVSEMLFTLRNRLMLRRLRDLVTFRVGSGETGR
jgi:uncharacterized protein YndB with AHSA1/START domain